MRSRIDLNTFHHFNIPKGNVTNPITLYKILYQNTTQENVTQVLLPAEYLHFHNKVLSQAVPKIVGTIGEATLQLLGDFDPDDIESLH